MGFSISFIILDLCYQIEATAEVAEEEVDTMHDTQVAPDHMLYRHFFFQPFVVLKTHTLEEGGCDYKQCDVNVIHTFRLGEIWNFQAVKVFNTLCYLFASYFK